MLPTAQWTHLHRDLHEARRAGFCSRLGLQTRRIGFGSCQIEGQTSKSPELFWCPLEHRASDDAGDYRRRFTVFSFVRSETWDETL
jgi:hypothetical protein